MPAVRGVPKSADAPAKSPGKKTLIPLKADASAERVSGRKGTKGAAENDTGRPNGHPERAPCAPLPLSALLSESP